MTNSTPFESFYIQAFVQAKHSTKSEGVEERTDSVRIQSPMYFTSSLHEVWSIQHSCCLNSIDCMKFLVLEINGSARKHWSNILLEYVRKNVISPKLVVCTTWKQVGYCFKARIIISNKYEHLRRDTYKLSFLKSFFLLEELYYLFVPVVVCGRHAYAQLVNITVSGQNKIEFPCLSCFLGLFA